MTATSHSSNATAHSGMSSSTATTSIAMGGLSKMKLNAREFGKEITNATTSSVSNNGGHFSSTMHPQTAKHSDHNAHHHPHASNIIGVSVASNGL